MSKESLKKFLKSQNHPSKAKKVSLETLLPSEYLIIDVRDPKVYSSTPHFPKALNFNDFEEIKQFCLSNQDKKILLVCNGGLEAAKIGTQLVESGLRQIYFLDEYLQIVQEYFPLENI